MHRLQNYISCENPNTFNDDFLYVVLGEINQKYFAGTIEDVNDVLMAAHNSLEDPDPHYNNKHNTSSGDYGLRFLMRIHKSLGLGIFKDLSKLEQVLFAAHLVMTVDCCEELEGWAEFVRYLVLDGRIRDCLKRH